MLLIVVLVFISVFLVLALVLFAGGANASQQAKLARANLETVLASKARRSAGDQIVDVRKSELLSAVPWVNRWLLQMELAPRLRSLLHQANLQWTVGRLLVLCGLCFIVPAYLVYLRTEAVFLALVIGVGVGYLPILY